MGTSISLNSTSYTIPATGEGGWSDDVSNYLIAAATGFLAKTGGSFTLTADVDFGANYGVKSAYYKSRGTVSSAGIMRFANAESIGWRNAANSGDKLLKVNSSDVLEFDGTPLHTAALGTAYYVWRMNSGGTASAWALLDNSSIAAGAAIAYSKLTLTGSIVNADISGSAAIAYSKLDLATAIVNADISASAAIAYSKLNLATSIVNADISGSAAIAYSKLALTGSIVDADLSGSASITRSKLASGTASHVLINDGSGVMSSEAQLAVTRGGTGAATAAAGFDALAPTTTRGDIIARGASSNGRLAIGTTGYVLKSDGTDPSWGQIADAGIAAAAAIAVNKLAALTASRAMVTDGSGFASASSVTATELGYVSGVTSAIQTQIDAKAPLASANTFTAKQTARVDDASNTSVTQAARVSHTTSGSPGVGIGVGVEFEAETSASNNEVGATIEAVTTAVGAGAEDFDLVFKTMTAGAAADEKARLKSTGQMRFKNLAAAPSNPQAGDIYYNSTSNKFQAYNGSAWGDIGGSGSGGINYIADAASALTDATVGSWVQYDEGSGATPTDGTGDHADANQLSAPAVDTTTKLRGANSLKLVKAAASAQGEGYSCAYTSHEIDKNSLQEITFNFDCSDANYTAGDVVVYIYDVTNAALITPSQTSVPAGKGTFKALFVNGNSNSYRLILHYAGSNASAQTLYFDNFMVGPVREGNVGGVPSTEWRLSEYTFTYSGLGTVTSEAWTTRREANTMYVYGYFATGTTTASDAAINLPSGILINSTVFGSGTQIVGRARRIRVNAGPTSDGSGTIDLFYDGSDTDSIYFSEKSGSNVLDKADGNYLFLTNDRISVEFAIPVAAWSGETVSMANSRVEWSSNSSVTDASDTTSFVYGPTGSALPSSTFTGPRKKRVRFQTAIQPTDRLELQINYGGDAWFPLEGNEYSAGLQPFTYQNTTTYGIGYDKTTINSTDIDVVMGQYFYVSGATYASAGANWSATTGAWKWRLVKSSNPLGIGTGLATATTPGAYAAGMAPGATNGAAIAAGYVGEKITWTSAPTTQALTTSFADWTNATITLTAGTWLVTANIAVYYATATTAGAEGYTQVRITDTSNNIIQEQDNILFVGKAVSGTALNFRGTLSFGFVANLSSSTTYKIRAAALNNSGTGSGNIENEASFRSRFFAVRIA
jgi:hypothetical protein